jgi:DNA-binding MarR family transcriptional regulator
MPASPTASPPAPTVPALDTLPRSILRAWMTWKGALEANYAAEDLDGVAPTGSGLVIFALYEREGWTVGELAQRARVTHVAVIQLLQRLEKAGLVRRKACPQDGRVTRVWLTKRGRELEPKMRALHERNLATLTGVLGAEDATRLGELLLRLIEGLAARETPMPRVQAEKN